jgi:hypothetical protein
VRNHDVSPAKQCDGEAAFAADWISRVKSAAATLPAVPIKRPFRESSFAVFVTSALPPASWRNFSALVSPVPESRATWVVTSEGLLPDEGWWWKAVEGWLWGRGKHARRTFVSCVNVYVCVLWKEGGGLMVHTALPCYPHLPFPLRMQLPPPRHQKATEVAWCIEEDTQKYPPSCIKPPQCPLVHVSFRFGRCHSIFLISHISVFPRPIATMCPRGQWNGSLRARGHFQVPSSMPQVISGSVCSHLFALFLGDLASTHLLSAAFGILTTCARHAGCRV